MLVWGSRTVSKHIGETPEFECRTCKTTAPHALVHTYTWGHLWYLGAVTAKHFHSVCNTCQTTDKLDNAKVESIAKPSYPFYQKFGWLIWVVLISVIAISGMISDQRNRDQTAQYLTEPAVGDVYALDISEIATNPGEYHYGLLRIKTLKADEIEFQASEYIFETQRGLIKALDKGDSKVSSFTDDTILIPKTKIVEMRSKGKILRVQR